MSDVLTRLAQIISEVVGPDFLLDVEITRETTFSDDLGLESIEFVALADKLRAHYDVDLVGFLADMDIDEIMAMSVGRLADHIEMAAARG
ncbi:acyl carrier protein [Lentzea tibetensis]|uniref:Acyl carrier protein n=1 Tax=Lentzea tibetensis TaxID=2591470 RepID=A0A563F137_9PSEU|nr:phosphopantetheine-binding protein [Lentzea tibetensis]TWP53685.1 acyl carrier protein [Lentzea tibetensis]